MATAVVLLVVLGTGFFLLPPAASLTFDSDWDITLDQGPTVTFSDDTLTSEVEYSFSYTGTLGDTKSLNAEVRTDDCLTAITDGGISITSQGAQGSGYNVVLDVEQNTISTHAEFQDAFDNPTFIGGQTAILIPFCVRVDYYLGPQGNLESVNFLEVQQTLTLLMNANFAVVSAQVQTRAATTMSDQGTLEYTFDSYLCDSSNPYVQGSFGPYNQGSVMSVCIESSYDSMYPAEVTHFMIQQTSIVDLSETMVSITDGASNNALVNQDCNAYGQCMVSHVVPSKFFKDSMLQSNGGTLPPLTVTGAVRVAFGSPPGRRLRTVPFRLRLLQEDRPQTNNATAEFSLTAPLRFGNLGLNSIAPMASSASKTIASGVLLFITGVVSSIFC